MCDLEEQVFPFEDGVKLHRILNPKGMPVLLLHGGGARHQTFRIPTRDVDGTARCLADWLLERGFEPWLLDWRAGATAVERAEKLAVRNRFDLDRAAEVDIPLALQTIRDERPNAGRIGAVGHCVGAGALAQAIASGHADTRTRPPLTHLVLLTLGLFYETSLEGRLKTQDQPLERVWSEEPDVDRIDPQLGERWPAVLEEMYQNWPASLHPHPAEKPSRNREICNRASFMYGTPYLETQLVPEIHSDTWALSFERGVAAPLPGEVIEGERPRAGGVLDEVSVKTGSWAEGNAAGVMRLIDGRGPFESGDRLSFGGDAIAVCTGASEESAQLEVQFGAIPLRLFRQVASNVRRRWAAGFDKPDDDTSLVADDCRKHFDGLAVTLLTGARNQLWSPDSVRRMYEWLTRGTRRPGDGCRRVILERYGHQDLLWGRSAYRDVFPEIGRGLGWTE